MRKSNSGVTFLAWATAAVLTLSACAGVADDDILGGRVDPSVQVDRSAFAGNVTFSFSETLPLDERQIPLSIGVGLTPISQTRLGARAFADLRHIQLALPELLTGSFDPSCRLGIDVRFDGAEARAETVRASGSADVRLYACRQRGDAPVRRGALLVTQTIDIGATVVAGLEAGCVVFRLEDLAIAPRGFLGGLATALGVTERSRVALRAKTETILSENPVCPELPPSLQSLDLQFASAGLREIGQAGIGAALSGSVDLNAATIVEILAVSLARRPPNEASARVVEAEDDQLRLQIDSSIDVSGTPVGWALDVGLAAEDATRIGIDAVLDLQDVQARLPTLLTDEVLLDNCGVRMTVQSVNMLATGSALEISTSVALDIFECVRTGAKHMGTPRFACDGTGVDAVGAFHRVGWRLHRPTHTRTRA